MTPEYRIKEALFEEMESIDLGCQKCPENTEQPTTTQAPWVRYRIHPTLKMAAALGPTAPNLHKGLFHIETMFQKDTGAMVAQTIADLILEHFKRGHVITYNGDRIVCEMAEIKSAYNDEGWYVLPVIVTYRTHMEN